MFRFLLITPQKAAWSDFAAGLEKESDAELAWAENGQTALAMLSSAPVDLAVADETLEDMTGLEFAAKLISVNPMINCAVVSALSKKEFHEAGEGLGLVQLPKNPGASQAADLCRHLRKITIGSSG